MYNLLQEDKKMSKKRGDSGRLFTASLKPAWTGEEINAFTKRFNGIAVVWAITHDKDANENGEIIAPHTHFIIEYETPRKISTVARVLNVADNFVELGDSKKALMRYLTHLDDTDKFQYAPSEVLTNSTVPYGELILGTTLSDRDIADYIREGRGYELLGVVSSSKLRTIQAFLQYDISGRISSQIKEQSEHILELVETINTMSSLAERFLDQVSTNLGLGLKDAVQALNGIREEAKMNRLIQGRKGTYISKK